MKRDKWDKAFSDAIRERDNWVCQRCQTYYPEGKRQGLHCSHFYGRAKYSTRFDFDNAEALCYGCHQYFTSHPALHREHKINRLGDTLFQQLTLRSNNRASKKDLLSDWHYKILKTKLKKYREYNDGKRAND